MRGVAGQSPASNDGEQHAYRNGAPRVLKEGRQRLANAGAHTRGRGSQGPQTPYQGEQKAKYINRVRPLRSLPETLIDESRANDSVGCTIPILPGGVAWN